MFKRKTLFVLGAGASKEAALPVGVQLAKIISEMLAPDSAGLGNVELRDTLLRQLYDRHSLPNNGYHQAATRISEGVRFANSIDDFLDRHSGNELIQRVGKIAIVKSILDAEAESLFTKNLRGASLLDGLEGTWYIKFFRMLGADVNVSNVREIFNNVAFIVFNYDRCLEHFFQNALHLTYGIGETSAQSIVASLDIVHPYGIAAPLSGHGSGIPFGGTKGYDFDCAGLSEKISIYTEQILAGDMLKRIRGMMRWAEQIVFLGFGYHEQNMRLLRPEAKMNLKPVFGTAVKMSESSVLEVRKELASMFTGSSSGAVATMQITDKSCADFFDYHVKVLPAGGA